MILDTLKNAGSYLSLNAGFSKAFEFMNRHDLKQLEDGRHEIDGDKVFAIVIKDTGAGKEHAKLEAHRSYIDIQFMLEGCDLMGWKSLADCSPQQGGYNSEKDLEFFADESDSWVAVGPDTFVIFFPADAHAPSAGTSEFHKVVVKVAI